MLIVKFADSGQCPPDDVRHFRPDAVAGQECD
jgi:hypothetical protein